MLRVTCHVSRVICHMSRVTCHVSHVVFFLVFFGQSGEAYWWRVCYQRGLPRLVLGKLSGYTRRNLILDKLVLTNIRPEREGEKGTYP